MNDTNLNENRMYVFGNLKGGVGKTECALSMITALDGIGVDVEYGEIDEVRRLSQVLDDKKKAMVSLKTSPDQVSGFATEQLQEFMNPVVSMIESPVSVLDLGANVSERFLEWAENSGLEFEAELSGTRMCFVSVTTTDAASLAPAAMYLMKAWNIFGEKADYVLISNDVSGGGTTDLETNPVTRDTVEKLKSRISDLKFVTIPNCPPTKSITYSRNSAMSIYELHDMIEEARKLVNGGVDLKGTDFASYAEAVDLQAHKSTPEKRLFLGQQLIHVKKWISNVHQEMVAGLGLKMLQSATTIPPQEKEEA